MKHRTKTITSRTVRLRLQIDHPMPATRHCTDFGSWLIRTDVMYSQISLVSSASTSALVLGCPLAFTRGTHLLPPHESAQSGMGQRLPLSKMRREEVSENPVIVTEPVLTSYLGKQRSGPLGWKRIKKLVMEIERSIGRGKRPTTVRTSWI